MGLLFSLALVLFGGGSVDHSAFTAVLNDHVHQGRVDYVSIKKDPRFSRYMDELKASDPEAILGRDNRLAYWINVYNAFTIKVVIDHYPINSIKDIGTGGALLGQLIGQTVWDKKVVTLAGRTYTLNQVEHEIIRPYFKDPRVHFALVCAAKSCPELRNEAYTGDRVDSQLDDQAREFLNDNSKNVIRIDGMTAKLSPIFKWFQTDFAKDEKGVLDYIASFLSEKDAGLVQSQVQRFSISYLDYDWSLNE